VKFIRLFLFFTIIISNYTGASPLTFSGHNSSINTYLVDSVLVNSNIADEKVIRSVIDFNLFTLQDDVLLEQQSGNDNLFILPRVIRANATEFNALAQLNPNYFVEIEFFAASLSAALFKNLINPPLLQPWFMQYSFTGAKLRLAGWKESNSLYTARNTYHS